MLPQLDVDLDQPSWEALVEEIDNKAFGYNIARPWEILVKTHCSNRPFVTSAKKPVKYTEEQYRNYFKGCWEDFLKPAMHVNKADFLNGLFKENNKEITCLHMAAKKGYDQFIKHSLTNISPEDRAALINRKTIHHKTALYLAVESNKESTCSVLLKFGADETIANLGKNQNLTAIHLAAQEGHCITSFCELRPESLALFNKKYAPIHLAAKQLCGAYVIQKLLNKGVDPNLRALSLKKQTALHLAVSEPSYEFFKVVEVLCAGNADPTLQDAAGVTPLHSAARYTHAKSAAILLDHFPAEKIDIPDMQGYTPLFRAIHSYIRNEKSSADKYKIIQQLLAKGADPTILTAGITPISLLDKENEVVPNEVRELVLFYLTQRFEHYQADRDTKLNYIRFLITNGADYLADVEGKNILNSLNDHTSPGVEDVINEFINDIDKPAEEAQLAGNLVAVSEHKTCCVIM